MNYAIELLNIAPPSPRTLTREELAAVWHLAFTTERLAEAYTGKQAQRAEELAERAEELAEELAEERYRHDETREQLAEQTATAKSLHGWIERHRCACKWTEDQLLEWRAKSNRLAAELAEERAQHEALRARVNEAELRARDAM